MARTDASVITGATISGKNFGISKIISPTSPYTYKLNFKSAENLTRNKIYDIIYIGIYNIYIKIII